MAKFYTASAENQKKLKLMKKKNRQLRKSISLELSKELDADLDEEKGLSIQELKNHVRQNHPKKTNEEDWPLTVSLSNLFSFKSNTRIPKVLNDIGLGASLYLLTLKAYAILFFFLTLINIPVILIYQQGG